MVEYFKLDVKISGPDEIFPSQFSTHWVPKFRFPDGTNLAESVPIVLMLLENVKDNGGLLGNGGIEQYSKILQWMLFMNYEIMDRCAVMFRMLVGRDPLNREIYKEAEKGAAIQFGLLEAHLSKNRFFLGEKLTIADLYGVPMLLRGFTHFLGSQWREQHPHVVKWWKDVTRNEIFGGYFDDIKLVEESKDPFA